MSHDLEKWTNQARFILMIIDGKLVVSKKKKAILVQELRAHNFKPIGKNFNAPKEKSLDPLADEEEEKEDEENADLGAADYDYLLGMPIWSLTKERIDRLQKQIAEREAEIDTLNKLTPQDLWKKDLDEFIFEWRFQLEDEANRQKKAAKLGRRTSKKVNVGVGGRKRKANNSDDSDFDAAPKTKKAAAPKPLPGGMLNYLVEKDKSKKPSKPKAPTATEKFAQKALNEDWFGPSKKKDENEKTVDGDEDIWMPSLDGVTEAKKSKAPTALKIASSKTKKPDPIESDVDEEIALPTAGHKPRRAAANKPAKYALSDSDDSDGDFDVGAMVKGIGSATDANSRPLFSETMSRPGSSAGLPRKSTAGRDAFDVDADDTDYTKLAPPTTSKGPATTARHMILSDDDEDESLLASSPPAKASKPAPKAKAVSSKPPPKPKTTTAKRGPTPQAAPKPTALSPAAKAYAAKKAKAASQAAKQDEFSEDEEDDKMADDDDDDDDDDEIVVSKPRATSARPGRGAAAKAATKAKSYAISDDEEHDEEDDFDEDESFD